MKALDPDPRSAPQPIADEAAYLMRRAEQEAIAAIRAEPGPGALLHNRLALGYSVRAIGALLASEPVSADERDAPAAQPIME